MLPEIGDLDEATDTFVPVCDKHCTVSRIIFSTPVVHDQTVHM